MNDDKPLIFILGIFLVAVALRFVLRPTRITGVYVTAGLCAFLASLIYSSHDGIAFDHRIGGPIGLAYLLSRLGFSIGTILLPVAARMSANVWEPRLYKTTLIPFVVLGVLFLLCWWLTLGIHVADRTTLYYQGYYLGHPDAVFLMSLVRGIWLVWYSIFVVHTYALIALQAPLIPRWRVLFTAPAWVAIGFVGSIGLGMIVLVEAVTDKLGHPLFLPEVFFVSFIFAIGSLMCVYVLYITMVPLLICLKGWMHAQELYEEALRVQDENKRAQRGMRAMNSRLEEMFILLRGRFADKVFVDGIDALCEKEEISGADHYVLHSAAVILSLHPDHLRKIWPVNSFQVDDEELSFESAASVTHKYAEGAGRNVFHYDDVDMIIALARGAEQMGVTFLRMPTAHHRQLAAILARYIDTYDQPTEYLTAYDAYLRKRARNQHMMLDTWKRSEPETARPTIDVRAHHHPHPLRRWPFQPRSTEKRVGAATQRE